MHSFLRWAKREPSAVLLLVQLLSVLARSSRRPTPGAPLAVRYIAMVVSRLVTLQAARDAPRRA